MTDKSYRVVELRAENFKRLKAVRIVPAGSLVEITGENAQGKSSVLDALWAALGGKPAGPAVPIRQGEKTAEAFVDLGDLKVTRRWWFKEGGALETDVRVESADGARYGKPQDVLNALVGRMTFDPLEFSRWKPEEQFKALRAFVPGVDFEKIAGLNKRDFENRTDVNREVKRLEAEAAGIEVPEDAPQPVDVAALEAQLAEAGAHNTDRATKAANRKAAEDRIEAIAEEIKRLAAEAETLRGRLEMAGPLSDPIDTAKIAEDLAAARQTNAIAERVTRKADLTKRAEEAQAKADALTAAIDARKADMDKAVAAAEMPVPGIGFGDEMVLLNGLPFSQASKAEKLRASIAIAAALNPRLRVLRVEDGAFLDAHARAMVEEFAEAHDYQVWLETIESGSPGAIVIEDGGIKEADAPPATDEEECV